MKKLLLGIATIAVVSVVLSAVGVLRHAGHGGTSHRASVARITVHNASGGPVEKTSGMAEESESAEVPSGFSPIASAMAATTPSTAAPIPSRWVDGKNYSTLVPAQPTSSSPDKVEVVEVLLSAWATPATPSASPAAVAPEASQMIGLVEREVVVGFMMVSIRVLVGFGRSPHR